MRAPLAAALFLLLVPAAAADPVTVAAWTVELTGEGPGLMLRDVAADARAEAAARLLAERAPDVVLLMGVDYDAGLRLVDAFAARVAAAGTAYPHRLSLRPNRGMATGIDLDGDGRLGEPDDAQGWGRFAGEGGMAILSRLPIRTGEVTDLSALLWRDLPGAIPPPLPPEVAAVQRLSTTGHWIVPVDLPDGRVLRLLVFHATPPVFDGPEDRNGRRNHDEVALWSALLDGRLPVAPPPPPLMIAGNANLDPLDGQGRREALAALLADPRLQDPAPRSGVHGTDTVDWPEAAPDDPGDLRVVYLLPSADLQVRDGGVIWPDAGQPLAAEAGLIRHKLVWLRVE